MNLKNKVIIITGGLGLLGKSFVKAVLNAEGIVVVADISIASSGVFVSELQNEGLPFDNVWFKELDITSKDSVQECIVSVSEKYGKIDAVVNNAHPRNANYLRKLENSTYEDFCGNLNNHLGGFFLCMQQFSIFFKKQGFGNVVSMSSVYGIIAPRFEVYENADFTMPVEYAAIKSGVIHLTKYFAKYYKGSNIRFNCICPGGVFNDQHPDFVKKYNALGLNKGMLNKNDLSGTLIFLLSDASQFINAQNIVVDDGWSL